MAGYPPGDFDVTALTATPNIVRKGETPPELFDLSAEFDGSSLIWGIFEMVSDPNWPPPPLPPLGWSIDAKIRWFLESIGPGPELIVAEATQRLTVGGGPYTVQVTGIDPDGTFTQPDGSTKTLDAGVYRLQCRVDVVMGPSFFTGYFDTDVLFRAAAA